MRQRFVTLAVLSLGLVPVLGAEQAPSASGAAVAVEATKLVPGASVQDDIRSGGVREYLLTADAGDLVSGTLEVRGHLAWVVEFVSDAGTVAPPMHLPEGTAPKPLRLGFVAPVSGTYQVRIRAFDRLDNGPQWALGAVVPVVGRASGSYTLRLEAAPVAVRMRGEPQPAVREEHPSPRLAGLARDLQNAQDGALDSFWRELAGAGPIVEEIPGNDREVDVTFLWRATYDTRNVLLIWCPRTEDCYMSHLPGTDVWYKTIRLRRAARVSYALSPNDRQDDRWATWQLDPLAPGRTPDDPNYVGVAWSVLELPGAPDEQWVRRQPVSRGVIQERTVTSAVLRSPALSAMYPKGRPIWTYTPPGYDPARGPYPLLVLLDGAAYVSDRFGNAPATLDNLVNEGRIRPTIVLFDLGNRGGGREGRLDYGEALVKEVMPMLRASYPISAHPRDIVIGGSSGGGLAAAEIALRYPEVFGNVLAQSGAFRAGDPGSGEPNAIAQAYLAAPRQPIRFYLDAGLYDNVPGASLPIHDLVLDETNLQGNRHFRDVLRGKGYDVTYREVAGGHDWLHWRAMLADGLMTLLGQ